MWSQPEEESYAEALFVSGRRHAEPEGPGHRSSQVPRWASAKSTVVAPSGVSPEEQLTMVSTRVLSPQKPLRLATGWLREEASGAAAWFVSGRRAGLKEGRCRSCRPESRRALAKRFAPAESRVSQVQPSAMVSQPFLRSRSLELQWVRACSPAEAALSVDLEV